MSESVHDTDPCGGAAAPIPSSASQSNVRNIATRVYNIPTLTWIAMSLMCQQENPKSSTALAVTQFMDPVDVCIFCREHTSEPCTVKCSKCFGRMHGGCAVFRDGPDDTQDITCNLPGCPSANPADERIGSDVSTPEIKICHESADEEDSASNAEPGDDSHGSLSVEVSLKRNCLLRT